MRLIVDHALFAPNSTEEADALISLFSTIARHLPYQILLTNPVWDFERDNGHIDAWLTMRGSYEAEALRRTLTNSLQYFAQSHEMQALSAPGEQPHWHIERTLTIHVERRAESDWKQRRLTVTDAADLVREPLHIFLENGRNDFGFLGFLAGPTEGQVLREIDSQPSRVKTYGGGCGEILKHLEPFCGASLTPPVWRKLLRTWVMFDQDAGNQNALEPSDAATRLLKRLNQIRKSSGGGLSWVCLDRREIESFVPDDGLRATANDSQREFAEKVISWRSTAEFAPWAWKLDLKKGLRGDLRGDLEQKLRQELRDPKIALSPQLLKAPFDSLPSDEVRVLQSGYGDLLSKLLGDKSPPPWVHKIPDEYDRGRKEQAPRLELIKSLFDRM